MRILSLLSLLLFSSTIVAAPLADVVLLNGKIWTVEPTQPEAEAIAVLGDRILFVGSTKEAKTYLGEKTKVIDLQGKRVVPGFYDSHVHMLGGGQLLSQVNLKDCKDEKEFGERLQKFDRELPRDRWLVGGNWDHDRTFDGKLPTAALIDKYVPNRPVFLQRYDGHMAIANSVALKLANITEKTKDPDGGVVFRLGDEKTPSGVLKDNAMYLVERLVPQPSDEEIAEAIRASLNEASRLGVTSVQDMDGSDFQTRRKLFRIYQRFARNGNMTCRVDHRRPIASASELINLGAESNFGNEWIRIGGVKGFIDGSLGSSTAKMFEPYEGEKTNTGVFVTPREEMLKMILAADKGNLSVAIHAIGDRANADLLDLFAETSKQNGKRDRRFRIEHAQHLREVDIKRFAELNVIASMQPYHIIDDGRWAEGRIGSKRCSTSYANRSILDTGGKLAFGSDWPVAPLDPIVGIDAAVHRKTLENKHPTGWFPEQRITVQEAIAAYTLGSAYAAFQEKERGSIKVGKYADFVVLSQDILADEWNKRITEITVEMTIAGGKTVYEKKK
jgi:predicted amidohydrolase YtcJ